MAKKRMKKKGMADLTFTCTSNEPYDRHHYKLVYKSGKEITYESWEQVQVHWFNSSAFLDHIEVLDK